MRVPRLAVSDPDLYHDRTMGVPPHLGSTHGGLALGSIALAAAGIVSTGIASHGSAPDDAVRYSRDTRPLLSDRCFLCHGPDEAARKADLRLDTFARATADRGGYAAIAPGDVEASELWFRVTSDGPEQHMPPAGSHRAEKAACRKATSS